MRWHALARAHGWVSLHSSFRSESRSSRLLDSEFRGHFKSTFGLGYAPVVFPEPSAFIGTDHFWRNLPEHESCGLGRRRKLETKQISPLPPHSGDREFGGLVLIYLTH